MSSGYGFGYGAGSGGSPQRFSGDVAAYAAQFQPPPHHSQATATATQALASAVALPGVFSAPELQRTLRRHNGDVMRAALQLREKHAFRTQFHFLELNVGLPTLQVELRKGYVHVLEGAADSEGCPVLLLQLQYFLPAFDDQQRLQRQGRGAADGSAASSLEDARRLCVYLLDLAVETMEERSAPGIVFLIDLGNCSLANLEAKMVTDVLQMCKKWYPEVVKRVLVLNGSAVTRVLTLLLSKLAGSRTQSRIRVLHDVGELFLMLPRPAIPQQYGGEYRLQPPNAWLKMQADVEGVDLDAVHQEEQEEEEVGYGMEEREVDPNESLNGMQYAAVSAVDAAEMPNSVLRGPLMRKKTDGVWAKLFALLRPEALLLYESATGALPLIIIPVNNEVRVAAATFPDRPRGAGFRVEVPGVVGGHELAANSEQERGNWLQELQWAIDASREKLERREEREEHRAKKQRDFAALNMISFDVELPLAAQKAAPPAAGAGVGAMQQQQVRPPQPVGMTGMPTAGAPPMSMGMASNMVSNMTSNMMPPTPIPYNMAASGYNMQQQPLQTQMPMQMQMQQPMQMQMQMQQPMQMQMQMQQPTQMPMQLPMQMQMQHPMQVQMQHPMQMQMQLPMQMQMQMQPGSSASSGLQMNAMAYQQQLLQQQQFQSNFRG